MKTKHYIVQQKRQAGFTIVELLVVLMVIFFVGGIVGSIFFVSLRSAKKSNTLALVRQNGYAAISKISQDIRYKKSVIGLTNSLTTSPVVWNACSPASVASPPGYQYIKVATYDTINPEKIYYCPSGINTVNNAISMGYPGSLSPITDTNVSHVENCVLQCTVQDTGATTVSIMFDMIDPNNSGLFESTAAPIPFSTIITLRNY